MFFNVNNVNKIGKDNEYNKRDNVYRIKGTEFQTKDRKQEKTIWEDNRKI